MLKINKKVEQTINVNIDLKEGLSQELELYIKIGQANKQLTKDVSSNDIFEQLLINLFEDSSYQAYRQDYMTKLEEKRAKARAKAREKKANQKKK